MAKETKLTKEVKAKEEVKKRKLNKQMLAIVVLAAIILGMGIYLGIDAFNASQANKINNAAVYGATVTNVQLFSQSANCNPVSVVAFDEQGTQLQRYLMEINPECMQAYSQAAQQLMALQQQAAAQ